MTLTHKERLRRALEYKPVDRIPTQVNYTRAMGEKMSKHFEVALDELDDHFDNHMLRVDISYEGKLSPDGRVLDDWWGVGFDTQEEGYFTAVNPLADTKDLDEFPWPNPHDPNLLEQAAEIIEADHGEHFITPNFGFALFERAWSLRGFDALLMDLVLDPKFVDELLERITEIQIILIRRFLEMGVDGAYFGDDYGAQNNMLFSPKVWRKLIKPRLGRMFTPFREVGIPILMHSDGQITDILPDLVDIGLTTLNPVQPEVLNHTWLKNAFGERLAYYGGVSTQNILPQGTKEDVKKAVVDCAAVLAPNNTGLLIAPSHRMMLDIPMDNVEAMLNAFASLSLS